MSKKHIFPLLMGLLFGLSMFAIRFSEELADYEFEALKIEDPYKKDWDRVQDKMDSGLTASALILVEKILDKSIQKQQHKEIIKALDLKLQLKRNTEEDYFAYVLPYLTKLDSSLVCPSKEYAQLMLTQAMTEQAQHWQINQNPGSSTDFKLWNRQNFQDTITGIHKKILQSEQKLKHFNVALLDTLDTDLQKAYPALFDVMVQKMILIQQQIMQRQAEDYQLSPKDVAIFFSVDESFLTLNFPKNNTNFLLELYQKTERFHCDKKPQSAYLYAILKRLRFAASTFEIEDEQNKQIENLVALSKLFPNNYFLDEVYYELASKHAEKAKAEKHSTHFITAIDYLTKASAESKKHKKANDKIGELQTRIENPSLSVECEQNVLPQKRILARVEFSNLQNKEKEHFLYIRILKHNNMSFKKLNNINDYEIDTAWKKSTLHKIKLFNKHDYNKYSTYIELPPLTPGYYSVISSCSSNFKQEHEDGNLRQTLICVTNLSASAMQGENGKVEIRVKNAESGMPISNANIVSYSFAEWENKAAKPKGTYKTDSNGIAKLQDKALDYFVFTIEHKGEKIFFRDYYSFYSQQANRYEQHKIFTDRDIYRPGQQLYYKIISTSHSAEAYSNKPSITLLKNQKISLTLFDANWQKVKDTTLISNDFGSCSGTFMLPEGRMNGRWNLQCNNSHSYSFQVEEYKRPKFEVTVNTPKGEYKLNDSVTVTGKAVALSGAAIGNAKVKINVQRRMHYYYSYFWKWMPSQESSNYAISDQVTTNAKGEFTFTFFAKAPATKEDAFYDFEVTASTTDLTGETRSDKTSIAIGDKALQLSTNIGSNIEKHSSLSFTILSNNLQREFTGAQGIYEIEALEKEEKIYRKIILAPIDTLLISEKEFREKFPLDDIYYSSASSKKKGKAVLQGTFNSAENKTLDLSALKNLAPGKYRLRLKSKDKYNTPVENEQEFLLFDKTAKTPAITTDHWSMQITESAKPGEKATIVLASSYSDVLYNISLINDNKREWTKNVKLKNNQHVLEIPITEAHRGGISVLLSTTKNNRTYEERIDINVPYSNKRLDIKFETFRDKLSPGQQEKWKLILSGPDAAKVSAEMLTCMYDAALDELSYNYYDGVWQHHLMEENHYGSSLFRNGVRFDATASISIDDDFYVDGNNYYNDLYNYGKYKDGGYYRYGAIRGVGRAGTYKNGRTYAFSINANAVAKAEGKVMALADSNNSYDSYLGNKKDLQKEKVHYTVPEVLEEEVADRPANTNIPLRKNFNETAFFFPHLRTNEKGEIIIEFTLPESLTRWKFKTWAHTSDLLSGFSEKEIIAQKNLMITSFAPRFLRANDEIVLTAKVDNISTEAMSPMAHIQLLNAQTMQPLSIKNPDVSLTVAAQSSQKVEWIFSVPEDVDAIIYRISAETANNKDGEELIIPVLKNKMLVRETMPMTIYSGETASFEFDKLKNHKSSTLTNHKYTVEFTANPAWSAIQSMPYLMEFPHECAEQTFSRVFANAITRHIMNSSPKIKAIFAEWEKTKGNGDALLSALDKNPELKSVLLKETPWVNEAQNETEAKRRLAKLFAGNELNKNISVAVKRLIELEHNGWSWFDGGRPNFYITSHIVGGFGHLNKLNASENLFREFPRLKGKVQNGVEFMDREINEWYKEEIKHKTIGTPSSEVVHYLYSRSFYPDIAYKHQSAMTFYLEHVKKHWKEYCLQNQAMIALTYQRMGDKSFAAAVLASLKERSAFSKEMGMYWKENGSSYYWWSAPIETQALLIEAFAEVGNDKESVERMRLWLLRNKQSSAWNSTKSTALACYALLLQGSDWLSTDNALSVEIAGKALVISSQPVAGNDAYSLQSEPGTGYVKTSWNDKNVNKKLAEIKVKNNGASVAFGAAHWEYFEQLDKITVANTSPLKIRKELYKVNGSSMEKIVNGSKIAVGDKIKVRLYISSDRQMDFIHLRDMRASALEPVDVISQYHYTPGAWYYQSVKDASVDFFFDRISKGEHVIEYELNVTHQGTFSNGISSIQCMYAPEFSAHSEGISIVVE
ncbi:MAG: alpha-2-macroglobulin family protein [Flavobacteriales bacterium]